MRRGDIDTHTHTHVGWWLWTCVRFEGGKDERGLAWNKPSTADGLVLAGQIEAPARDDHPGVALGGPGSTRGD